MTPGPLLLLAAAGLAAGLVLGASQPRGWLACMLLAAGAALAAAVVVLAQDTAWEWRSEFRVGGEWLHLRLDALSAWFIALLSVGGGLGAAYAHEYWADQTYPQSAPRGRMWWSAMILSQGVVLLTSNGLHFLIAWELFSVSAYFLITLDRQRREVRAAGWLFSRPRTSARWRCLRSSGRWPRTPAAGNSVPCATPRRWRRSSGWRSWASA